MAHQDMSDRLRLLRCINDTQAQGQEGARVDPPRAAQEIGLDVGSKRYHDALSGLVAEGALVGDKHTATETGIQPSGYAGHAVYFFSRRAVEMMEEQAQRETVSYDPDNMEAYPEAY
jgi:hypothetical protein